LAASPEFERAQKLYSYTDYDRSLKVLQAIPSKGAEVNALMGRNYYMQGDYKRACDSLEKAVAADPGNSDYALWLARAYGRRAETANPFTAPVHASRARQYFEKAVQLNSGNLEALSDLCDYYLEAPGFLGGGMEKAEATAERITRISPGEGYAAHARIAEKRKEYSSAEEQLRRAIDAAPQQLGRFIDLARFLNKQGRYQEADQSLARAEKIAPNSPRLLYLKADLYIDSGRNLREARALLQRYMSLALTPDDPPRSEAARLLKKVQGS
jgi:tetratricopeptide (TPR) repeat protein